MIGKLLRHDMNSLVVLYVLLEEVSVSRAAERLCLTQPAISKTLSKLRVAFDDELLVRHGRNLVLSAFAEALRPRLAAFIKSAGAVFENDTFQPAELQYTFRIALPQLIDIILIPAVIALIRERAPGVNLETVNHPDAPLEALAAGEVDFLINLRYTELKDNYHYKPIFCCQSGVIARAGHPLAARCDLSLGDILSYPRIRLHVADMEKLQAFHEFSKGSLNEWPVAFQTDNIVTGFRILQDSDYLIAAPDLFRLLAVDNRKFVKLSSSNLPLQTIEHGLIQHERTRTSAAHRWLAEVIEEAAAKLQRELSS